MIAKVCDICGKVETPERRDFHTFTHDWGCFKRVKDFHICSECMNLIKELRAKQKENNHDNFAYSDNIDGYRFKRGKFW